MYIIFQVLRFAQNLQRCARLSLFCRLSFCAPEPRASALHAVCCMETIKLPLSRQQQTECFSFRKSQSTIKAQSAKSVCFCVSKNRQLVYIAAPYAFVQPPKHNIVHHLSSFVARRNLQGLQIKLFRRLSLMQTRQPTYMGTLCTRYKICR